MLANAGLEGESFNLCKLFGRKIFPTGQSLLGFGTSSLVRQVLLAIVSRTLSTRE
jgi:hypothetical protein